MPTRISKFLLLFEAVVLIAPIGVLFLMVLPVEFALAFRSRSLASLAASVAILAMGAALVAAVRVISGFCVGGASGLLLVRKVWWWLCAAGAVTTVAGTVAALLMRSMLMPVNDFTSVLKTGMYGAPLMLPLAHVLLEYFFRSKSPHAA
jgi:hypothetical protein